MEPIVFDGTPDIKLFCRFVSKSTDYVTDGNVRSRGQIEYAAKFLSSKAHRFYLTEVAAN
jgi:hypothetical protein